jgi:hypothetical protein
MKYKKRKNSRGLHVHVHRVYLARIREDYVFEKIWMPHQ